MPLFSSLLLKKIQAAQRALLSPLQFETTASWLDAVTPRVQAIMGADHAYACLPTHRSLTVVGSDLDSDFSEEVAAGFGTQSSDHLLSHDPMPLQMHLQRIRGGAGAYHELDLADRSTIETSPSYQELFYPHGIRYAAGMSVPLSTGEAFICVGFESATADGYNRRGLRRMELLVPALESAVRQWQRFATVREEFSTLIDRLTDAVLLFDADGQFVTGSYGSDGERVWSSHSPVSSGDFFLSVDTDPQSITHGDYTLAAHIATSLPEDAGALDQPPMTLAAEPIWADDALVA